MASFLTNGTPVFGKRPVHHQATANHIGFRNGAPIAGIRGVIGVVTEGKETVRRHIEGGLGVAKEGEGTAFGTVGVATVAVDRVLERASHDLLKRSFWCRLAVSIERGRIDFKVILGDGCKALAVLCCSTTFSSGFRQR